MIISKLLYQRCVEGGRYNCQKIKEKRSIWNQAKPLNKDVGKEAYWAKKAIGTFQKEAQGAPMDISILPIDCVNRCPSGHLLHRLDYVGIHSFYWPSMKMLSSLPTYAVRPALVKSHGKALFMALTVY
jgi:hypothetical protein